MTDQQSIETARQHARAWAATFHESPSPANAEHLRIALASFEVATRPSAHAVNDGGGHTPGAFPERNCSKCIRERLAT